MKTKVTMVIVSILCGCVLFYLFFKEPCNEPSCSGKKLLNTTHTEPPEGYYIETDNRGRYRACRNGRPILTFDDNQTRQNAIDRAWDQYEYEKELKSHVWVREVIK